MVLSMNSDARFWQSLWILIPGKLKSHFSSSLKSFIPILSVELRH